MKYGVFIFSLILAFASCKKDNPKKIIDSRQFKMGFSTWSFGPTLPNVNASYDFVTSNGDVYSEHMDHKVPWDAWMNGSDLPTEFTDLVQDKVNRKPSDIDLLLSVSFLNAGRSDIMEDFDGKKPEYANLNDSGLVKAYLKHVSYLIDQLNPAYLVYSIESNELYINNAILWPGFRDLMTQVGIELKTKYPNLKMAESVTLHNWFDSSTDADYLSEVEKIANAGSFSAISFYPFFKQLNDKKGFQKAFDFLHGNVSIPIAFVETNHLAEDLEVDAYDLSIKSDEKEQKEYLETLLINAHNQQYQFVIWWAHRDYDALWDTFPDDVKALGKIWRDTGLQDEDGNDRPAMETWRSIFVK